MSIYISYKYYTFSYKSLFQFHYYNSYYHNNPPPLI